MIFKPTIESVPLADGLKWRGGDFLYQEKSDGRHEFAEIGGAIVNAERMADGGLVINDILSVGTLSLSLETTRARWFCLEYWWQGFRSAKIPNIRLCRVGDGGQFLERLLSEGGEGVIAKPLDSAFGVGWLKCKRSMVYFCEVIDLDPMRGSAILADRDSGEPRGKLALRGGKFELVRVGSILKVEAYGLTAKGLLREARPDRDAPGSWLVSV